MTDYSDYMAWLRTSLIDALYALENKDEFDAKERADIFKSLDMVREQDQKYRESLKWLDDDSSTKLGKDGNIDG